MECNHGKRCPYLKDADIWGVIGELNYLRDRTARMEWIMGLAQEKIKALTAENQRLKEEKNNLLHRLKKMVKKVFKANVQREGDEQGKKRGAPFGHHGIGRIRPKEVTEYIAVYPKVCVCGCSEIEGYEDSFDEHFVEDIEVKKKVTCYRMHYGRCQRCQEVVSPQRDESIIPNSRIGPQARAVSSYLHHTGIPYRKVAKIFRDIFHLEISHTSLLFFEKRQAENGVLLYEGIKEEIRSSPSVHADETGWRIDGKVGWLWIFVSKESVLYKIDESRGGKVVTEILGNKYEGKLISDFYSAYNQIESQGKQKCLAHLLGDIKEIEEKKKFLPQTVDERFCRELKGVLKKAISDWKKYKECQNMEELQKDKEEIISKVIEIFQLPIEDEDTRRIQSRIIKHQNELLTFLDNPEIEPTNNVAERCLRPAVIMRKISFGNRTEDGAKRFGMLMSIIQTGHMKGVEPLHILLTLTMGEVSSLDKIPPIRAP